MRIGITGHQALPPFVESYVTAQLHRELSRYPDLAGLSNLAAGADQIFAETVLSLGGTLEVILPAHGYEAAFAEPADRLRYASLLARAVSVRTLPFERLSEEAFLAAGEEIVRSCDLLLAVWDGQPARGKGGTADVVEFARQLGIPTRVIWPEGAVR